MACFGFGSETCFDVLPPDILNRTPPIGNLAICVLCAGSYRIEGAEDFHLAVVGLHRQAGFVGHQVRFVGSQVHFVGRQVRFVDRLVHFVDCQVRFVDRQVRFVDCPVRFVDRRVRLDGLLGTFVVVGLQQDFDVAEVAHLPLEFGLALLAPALGRLTQ